MGKSLDHVISIEVARDTLIQRLTARRQCRECGRIYNIITDRPRNFNMCDDCAGEVYLREDDTEETVINRLDVYDRNTAPLIQYYTEKGLLRPINGNRTASKVFDALAALVGA